jgi:phage-related protein
MRFNSIMGKVKKLRWVGSSREDLKKFPNEAQDRIGYGLYEAQLGVFPYCAKLLKGFSGVFEIICDFDKNTYRTVYATKLGDYVYVLHVFQKKSTIGIKTPKHEIDLIKTRLQTAKLIAAGEL